MKKYLFSILMLLHCSIVFSISYYGIDGNISWAIEDGILYVNGYGEMDDYYGCNINIDNQTVYCSSAPWAVNGTLCSTITSIVISDEITKIGSYAFRGCTSLQSVVLPKGLESIGRCAFDGCYLLSDITLPVSLQEIGNSAFYDCKSLRSITIPNRITTLGERVFSGCESLSDIVLSSGIIEIGEYTFCGCTSLKSVNLPYSVERIGNGAFYYCNNLCKIRSFANQSPSIHHEAFVGSSPVGELLIPDCADDDIWMDVLGNGWEIEYFEILEGDINYDGALSEEDTQIILNEIINDTHNSFADVNDDGRVDIFDFSELTYVLLNQGKEDSDLINICLSDTIITLSVNQEYQLVATIEPYEECAIEWYIDNNQVATVSRTGLVTAKNSGTAIVTAKCKGKSANCFVHVKEPLIPIEKVELNESSLILEKGTSFELIATIYPKNATESNIHWYSKDDKVATVSPTGTVVAISEGSTTIVVQCQDCCSSCLVTVVPPNIPVNSIKLNHSELSLEINQKTLLVASVLPNNASDKKVSWSSTNNSIVSVSDDGLVTAHSVGLATIIATCGGFTASCAIQVIEPYIPVASIKMNVSSLSLIVDQTYMLSVVVFPDNASEHTIHWQSSNDEIASVDASGLVSAKSVGKATISADCNNLSAVCEVEVSGIQITHEYVDLGLPSGLLWATSNIGANAPEEYGDYFAWGETKPKDDYTWSNYTYNKYDVDYLQYMKKYCIEVEYDYYGQYDGLSILEPEDDAATVNWGDEWRMPTYEETVELKYNCTWEWTTLNGIEGALGTGKNGNTIFFPASYQKADGITPNGFKKYYPYAFGTYWSSSLASNLESCHYGCEHTNAFYFSKGVYRYYGLTIRPVTDK